MSLHAVITIMTAVCSGAIQPNCVIYQTCENGYCKQNQPPAKVLINEVLYDAVGTYNDVFVELYGPPGTDLAGYFLVGLDGNGGTENIILSFLPERYLRMGIL